MGGDAAGPGKGDPWYVRAFGPLYPLVYGHRDDAEAERVARLVQPILPPGAVLDLACGAGRHLRALAAAGAPAIGLDLSEPLLRAARAADDRARLVRADMRRLPFRSGRFAAVLSLFTSFGYFETEEEDRGVLVEARRILAPDGLLVLDLANSVAALRAIGYSTEREAGGFRIVEQRAAGAEGRRLEKRVQIFDAYGRSVLDYVERVRLYDRDELAGILGALGFRIIGLWGDYGGESFDDRAPRMIVAANRGSDQPRSERPESQWGGAGEGKGVREERVWSVGRDGNPRVVDRLHDVRLVVHVRQAADPRDRPKLTGPARRHLRPRAGALGGARLTAVAARL